jgi:hypothetical protein
MSFTIIKAAIMAAQPTRKGGKLPSDTGDLEDLEPAEDGTASLLTMILTSAGPQVSLPSFVSA